MSKILDYWPIPEFTPRPNQIRALEWLEEQDAKYLFLQAPVGAGKSLIGATFAAYLQAKEQDPDIGKRASYVLTPQRILQEQYETSFPKGYMASLYGRGNYECRKLKSTCDVGHALKASGCEVCPYKQAKAVAQRSNQVVLNYKMALLMWKYTESWEPRPLLVLDECHTAEEHLTELDAVTATKQRAQRYAVKWQTFSKMEDALDWIRAKYYPVMVNEKNSLYAEVRYIKEEADGDLTPKEIRKVREYNGLAEHCEHLNELFSQDFEHIEEQFVLIDDIESMKFKRLHGGYTFNNLLKGYGNKVLLMSSTILNHTGFCKDLGIDPSEAAYLELDSEFPTDNRPVYYMPQCKMNAAWTKPDNARGRATMLDMVKQILDMHGDDSGIVHTGNFNVATWLTRELTHIPQTIWQHNPRGDGNVNRNEIINGFQEAIEPSILISPSITEGLDLKENLARFAIFVKIPFGYLGDKWIKQRFDMSKEWYQRRALIEVIQGGGRIVRSDEDWGNVYILDASWAFLYSQSKQFVPDWWNDAYLVQS